MACFESVDQFFAPLVYVVVWYFLVEFVPARVVLFDVVASVAVVGECAVEVYYYCVAELVCHTACLWFNLFMCYDMMERSVLS